MISKKFMIDYIEFFSPDAEKDEKTLEILSNFTDPYIEAANMAVLAIDKDRKIVMVNNLAAGLFEISEASLLDKNVKDVLPESPVSSQAVSNERENSLYGKKSYFPQR